MHRARSDPYPFKYDQSFSETCTQRRIWSKAYLWNGKNPWMVSVESCNFKDYKIRERICGSFKAKLPSFWIHLNRPIQEYPLLKALTEHKQIDLCVLDETWYVPKISLWLFIASTATSNFLGNSCLRVSVSCCRYKVLFEDWSGLVPVTVTLKFFSNCIWITSKPYSYRTQSRIEIISIELKNTESPLFGIYVGSGNASFQISRNPIRQSASRTCSMQCRGKASGNEIWFDGSH